MFKIKAFLRRIIPEGRNEGSSKSMFQKKASKKLAALFPEKRSRRTAMP